MANSGERLQNRFGRKTPVGATDALGQSEVFLEFQEADRSGRLLDRLIQ